MIPFCLEPVVGGAQTVVETGSQQLLEDVNPTNVSFFAFYYPLALLRVFLSALVTPVSPPPSRSSRLFFNLGCGPADTVISCFVVQ